MFRPATVEHPPVKSLISLLEWRSLGQCKTTYDLLGLLGYNDRNIVVITCSGDLFCSGNGRPSAKEFLVEGGKEYAKCLLVVVLLVELKLLREPRPLVSGAC